MSDYRSEYTRSVEDPKSFWLEKSRALDWFKQPESALGVDDNGMQRWFPDGEMNSCFMAVDTHVNAGHGARPAIIYDSPVSGQKQCYTYQDILNEVEKLAGAIQGLGLKKGDTAIIYMPMIPQAVFAMLACARLGIVHSVVFGGFAANELAARIEDAKPHLILSASCGLEPNKVIEYKPLLDEAINQSSHKPGHCIIYQRPQAAAALLDGRDLDWNAVVAFSEPAECVRLNATDPLMCSIHPAPRARRRALCGIMAATRWRSSTAWRRSMTSSPTTYSGPHLMWVG